MQDEVEETVIKRDFYARDADEQADFLSQTWCNQCMEMDLGMSDPVEYASQDRVWVEGVCVKCLSQVITEIVEEDEE